MNLTACGKAALGACYGYNSIALFLCGDLSVFNRNNLFVLTFPDKTFFEAVRGNNRSGKLIGSAAAYTDFSAA